MTGRQDQVQRRPVPGHGAPDRLQATLRTPTGGQTVDRVGGEHLHYRRPGHAVAIITAALNDYVDGVKKDALATLHTASSRPRRPRLPSGRPIPFRVLASDCDGDRHRRCRTPSVTYSPVPTASSSSPSPASAGGRWRSPYASKRRGSTETRQLWQSHGMARICQPPSAGRSCGGGGRPVSPTKGRKGSSLPIDNP